MKSLCLFLLSFFVFGDINCKGKNQNVLLIAIDDLNDWIGCLKTNSQAKTPNIDRLASRGMLFTNAHCQAPICNPSRTSFMLSLRPSTTGIYENQPWFRSVKETKNRITMGEHFVKNGYRTLTAGKIFHASKICKRSFQTYGPMPGQYSKKDKRIHKDSPSRTKLWDFGPQDYPEEEHSDYQVASWCIDQLKNHNEAPFFMAIGFYRPHVPLFAPKPYFESRPLNKVRLPEILFNDRDDLPSEALQLIHNTLPPSHKWFVDSGKWKNAVRAYNSCITFTDHQIGRVLDALDSSSYKDNTIIVLFSDHGFHLGEKQMWAKRSLWERSTRVPLIISTPHGLKGVSCSRPVELLSIFPTLSELCKLPNPLDIDGLSITKLLEDPRSDWSHPAITTFKEGNHSIRTERYRYIRYANGSEELYDHKTDYNEWNNVINDQQYSKVRQYHSKYLSTLE